MNKSKTWTLVPLLNTSAEFLERKGLDSPRLHAELLLCKVLNCSRMDLYLKYDRPVNDDELTAYRQFVKRASESEPLQYIVGHTEFMGLRIMVNPAVLIPRPETEILVRESIKELENTGTGGCVQVLEIGTGSGCISIALAAQKEDVRFTATDISEEALGTALENARAHKVENNIRFVQGDLFENLPGETCYNMIASNPPYVSEKEYMTLETKIRSHEPRTALLAGTDGLGFYRRIFEQAKSQLTEDGAMLLEIGYGQLDPVTKLATEHGWRLNRYVRDLNDIPRVVVLYL